RGRQAHSLAARLGESSHGPRSPTLRVGPPTGETPGLATLHLLQAFLSPPELAWKRALDPTLPFGRVTSGVKDGNDHHLASFLLVQYHIRELLHYRLADVLIYEAMQLRVGRDSGEHVPHLIQKCRAPPGPLLFVPVHGGIELVLGLGQQSDGEAHRVSRARAS